MNASNKQHPLGNARRGSTLLLAVVVLVMMVVIAAAYIRTVRLDNTAVQTINERNIDTVATAAIEQISQTLKDDLISEVVVDASPPDIIRKMFNAAPGVYNGGTFSPTSPGYYEPGDEYQDYPSTNYDGYDDANPILNAPSSPRNTRRHRLSNPNPENVLGLDFLQASFGGHLDDAWLASTEPDLTNPFIPTWPHITNLTGVFLQLPLHDPTNETIPRQPVEDVVSHKNLLPGAVQRDIQFTDTNLPITEDGASLALRLDTTAYNFQTQPLGFDADGDGIADSRWTWAPIKQIGNVKYVMAARIIDNSSLINLNTALAQLQNLASATPTPVNGQDSARWLAPTDVDLSRFVFDYGDQDNNGGTPPTRIDELEEVLDYRSNGLFTTSPVSLNERANYWNQAARLYANYPDTPGLMRPYLTIDNELELRYRNGISRITHRSLLEGPTDPTFGNSTDPHMFITFLRDYGVPTSSASDNFAYTIGFGNPELLSVAISGFGNFPAPGEHYVASVFNLNAAVSANTRAANIEAYFKNEPRHALTTLSGHSLHAPPLAGRDLQNINTSGLALRTPRRQKIDLNTATLEQIRDEMTAHFSEPNILGGTPTAGWEGWPASLINHPSFTGAEADLLGTQFAVNLQDYQDQDNILTELPIAAGGTDVYGWEALPMIGEVYVQARYQVTATDFVDDTTVVNSIEWTRQGETGYAIEIRNPYRKPISLENIDLVVINRTNGMAWNGGTGIPLWDAGGGGVLQTNDLDPLGVHPQPGMLGPDEVIILYRNSGSNPNGDGPDDQIFDPSLSGTGPGTGDEAGSPFPDDLINNYDNPGGDPSIPQVNGSNVEQYIVKQVAALPWPDGDAGDDLVVELRPYIGTSGAGAAASWAYARYFSRPMPLTLTENATSGNFWPFNPMPSVPFIYESEPIGLESVRQVGSPGNGRRLNMLTPAENELMMQRDIFVRGPVIFNTMPPTAENRSDNYDALGLSNKVVDGPSAIGTPGVVDRLDRTAGGTQARYLEPTSSRSPDEDPRNQFIFRDDGRIDQPGEIAHIAIIGPNPNNTINDAWWGSGGSGAASPEFEDAFSRDYPKEAAVERFMLWMTDTSTQGLMGDPDPNINSIEIQDRRNPHLPYGVALIDRFTTLDTLTDTVDNDGDGITDGIDSDGDGIPDATNFSDSDEVFLSGTININTMPRRLLARALPFPGPNEARTPEGFDTTNNFNIADIVAKAITEYRDNPETRPNVTTNANTNASATPNDNFSINGHRNHGVLTDRGYNRGISRIGEVFNLFNRNNVDQHPLVATPNNLVANPMSSENRNASLTTANTPNIPDSALTQSLAPTPPTPVIYDPVAAQSFPTAAQPTRNTRYINDVETDYINSFEISGWEGAFGAGADLEDVVDDREEQALILRWLSQLTSVRSDVYTAYIVIRGYPADDFRLGPVEQKRFIAVFDRSGIVDGSGKVKVVGMLEF